MKISIDRIRKVITIEEVVGVDELYEEIEKLLNPFEDWKEWKIDAMKRVEYVPYQNPVYIPYPQPYPSTPPSPGYPINPSYPYTPFVW